MPITSITSQPSRIARTAAGCACQSRLGRHRSDAKSSCNFTPRNGTSSSTPSAVRPHRPRRPRPQAGQPRRNTRVRDHIPLVRLPQPVSAPPYAACSTSAEAPSAVRLARASTTSPRRSWIALARSSRQRDQPGTSPSSSAGGAWRSPRRQAGPPHPRRIARQQVGVAGGDPRFPANDVKVEALVSRCRRRKTTAVWRWSAVALP